MAIVQFTTSSTGVNLGPGVVNGVIVHGTTNAAKVNLYDAASTTGTAAVVLPNGTNGNVPLGGFAFNTALTVGASAAYGGITVVKQ